MIYRVSSHPERNSLSAENGEFPFQIRDKLLGLGSRRGYRAVFTIQDDAVYVLTVRRASQDVLQPDQVDAPPTSAEE